MTKVAYKWTDNQSRLRVDRKLSSPTSERSKVKLSPSWKDNDQSRLQVDRKPKSPTMDSPKYKSSYLRVDERIKPPMSVLYKSSYLWVDRWTKPLTNALIKNLIPPTGGRTNQATYECLGQKSKFSYLRVDRWTKPLMSAWVKKIFKSPYLRVDEQTDPLTSVLVKDLPTYRVTNDPSDPPKIIDLNRNHWTKSPRWRTIPQRWSCQVAILWWQLT